MFLAHICILLLDLVTFCVFNFGTFLKFWKNSEIQTPSATTDAALQFSRIHIETDLKKNLASPLHFAILRFLCNQTTGYQQVNKETSKKQSVFFDFKKACNLGEARYLLDSAYNRLPGFKVTDDFASAVCRLTTEYKRRKYTKFIDDWGTVSKQFF